MRHSLEKAQSILDEKNGNFLLLEYKSVNNKNLTRCRTCGHEWFVNTNNLLRSISPSKGCPNCTLLQGKIKKLKANGLSFISYNSKTKRNQVKCDKCNFIFEGFTANLVSEKFNCQNCSKIDTKQYKLKKLLDGSYQSYYILGFICADGHISKQKRLRIKLSERDSEFLKNISVFLLGKDIVRKRVYDGYKSVEFSVMDTDTIGKIQIKFNLQSNKTYNPPTINLKGDAFTAFIIGFIDGDGHLGFRFDNGKPFYKVKNHYSWAGILQQMTNHLYQTLKVEAPQVRLIEDGKYAEVAIGNQAVVSSLKKFIKKNLEFVLNRKWRYNRSE